MLPPSEPGSVPGSVPSSSDESHFPPEIRLQLLRVAGGGTHQIHTAHPAAAGAPTASANRPTVSHMRRPPGWQHHPASPLLKPIGAGVWAGWEPRGAVGTARASGQGGPEVGDQACP